MILQLQNNKKTRRTGSSTLEFAALLPLFVVFALLIVESQEMMMRAMCNSHAAFTAARRWLVAGIDTRYIGAHYKGTGMRGAFSVTPSRSGSRPGTMTVTILDRYNILKPSGGNKGSFAGLKKEELSELSVRERVAGSGPRVAGSDNDIF